MKERVFLSNNQDGVIENYRMMHFLNVTDVLTNRVNCFGSTFNLTLFGRVVRDLRALLLLCEIHLFGVERPSYGVRLPSTTVAGVMFQSVTIIQKYLKYDIL